MAASQCVIWNPHASRASQAESVRAQLEACGDTMFYEVGRGRSINRLVRDAVE